jgi:anti-sigma factor RsiW
MIVLTDDLHWVRAQQQQLVAPDCDLYTGEIKARELRDYRRADMIVAVTAEDAGALRPYLENKPRSAECVHLIPAIANQPPPLRIVSASYVRRSGFLYVGSRHAGNKRAVKWLLEEVRAAPRRAALLCVNVCLSLSVPVSISGCACMHCSG